MESIKRLLTLWELDLVSSEEVIGWADEELLKIDEPSQELMDLSLDGPEKCLRRAEYEFPARPTKLDYCAEFSFRVMAIDLASSSSCLKFADWALRHAMGESLGLPEVSLGYHLEHLIGDCHDSDAAIELIRQEIPRFRPKCAEYVREFLAPLSNLKFDADTLACRSIGR